MTTKIHSPYKEEKPVAAQSFSLLLSSSAKLILMISLALLGCLNFRANSGVISRRKSSLQIADKKRSATLNVPLARVAAVDENNDDKVNESNESPASSYDILDEEMRRLLKERNHVGAKRGKVAWLMRCVYLFFIDVWAYECNFISYVYFYLFLVSNAPIYISFPNSGTSFTSLLVRVASNSTAATNYGMETRVGADGMSVPIYNWSVEGPYWMHPPEEEEDDNGGSTSSRSNELPPPSASILTKTHCGGRCTSCPPDKYLETIPSFLQMCLSGSRKVPSNKQRPPDKSSKSSSSIQYKKHYVTYHPAVVERAIHIIRNPFDNLVSRFHHEQKEYKKKNRTSWTNRYSNDVSGFKKWCVDVDSMAEKEFDNVEWKTYGYNPTSILHDYRGVSCHAEFFRYAQWHILANNVVELLDIPVLYVHYEEYAKDIKGLTDRILNFLNLDREEDELPTFLSNKDYSDYFTREERASASEFMRRLVDAKRSHVARELLERYWVEYDFKKLAAETGSIE